jgi:nucleoside-diphosphate-sugar epimerase
MNILLTGSNGFLGSYIYNYLQTNNRVITLSRKNAKYNLDLRLSVPLIYDTIDLVIHTAGKAHFLSKTKNDIQEYYLVNYTGTLNLLNGLEISCIPKYFVFISSVSVYGKDFGTDINENTILGAVDPYGISKIAAERLIIDWCKNHKVICTILRLPLIVGENPPGNLGAVIKSIQKGYYFNIGGGKTKKSMVLAEDIAKYILKAAEIGGIYNLTDGYHPSFFEISHLIASNLGKNEPDNLPFWLANFIAKFGDLIGHKSFFNTKKLKKITSELTFDDTKAQKAFGWNPIPIIEYYK